ncbi:MAG: hypothetical protein DWQ10_03245 [Calditrichaeota bacterium]|nr:MAG: hypothetical protein DWQ10_03245 [Calditrichota bacterium]
MKNKSKPNSQIMRDLTRHFAGAGHWLSMLSAGIHCSHLWFHLTIVLLIFSLFFFQCTKQESTENATKIVDAHPKRIATTDNGVLEIAGKDEDQIHVLTVWGTPYEMGKAHGTLLKEQIQDHVNNMVKLMVEKSGQPVEALDHVFAETKPFIPQHFLEEMQGLSDGSGVPLQEIIRANLIGEAGEWHCSLFGAWGKATAADGHLYQLRSLDYETGANIQKYPLVVVYQPDDGIPFANITWAGVVGCISGISQEQLAISEIGDDYHKESDTFAGIPFMFLLRDILQFDTSLDEAISRVCSANRTTSLMYGIGDGELGELRGLQTSHIACNVFSPQNLEPLTKAHKRIDDVVYWGMSWDVPDYDGPLHDKLVEHYGSINAEVTIKDILPFVRTGSLQTVVYDLTAMRIWVANARADHESGPLDAFDRQYVKFDMAEFFDTADSLAKQ